MGLIVAWILFSYLKCINSNEIEAPICLQTQPNLNNASIVALILARGGSKGITLKNIVKMGGQPLLVRTLRTLLNFGRFDSLWVSTDDDRIANEVGEAFPENQVLIHFRPEAVAQDHTSSIESTLEFLSRHPEIENIALVQCTSPFLRTQHLEEAFVRFHSAAPPVDCVFSAVRSFKLRWITIGPTGTLVPINFDPARRPRRQDWTGELTETGMFYLTRRRLLMAGRFQNTHCDVVEVAARDALEIDGRDDLELARMMVELRHSDGQE
ncbi:N-acylneuraminate cytidylyltransferase [Malaya genurostris]|uniref:N-acylneuraminate cytidylyltransferase n=1 Tax=Malaya genurostris TaxID=325434 RepID=UPI0026F3BEB6|nr:N-acylneuraminate cytidylyltransferase [Malaya genurostris]